MTIPNILNLHDPQQVLIADQAAQAKLRKRATIGRPNFLAAERLHEGAETIESS